MCKRAETLETLPQPHANCNARGDGVVRRRGPGGLYNQGLSCQQRITDLKQHGVTYFQTENIFHRTNLDCLTDMQLLVTLRKPMSRVISHIRYERMFQKDGVKHFRDASFNDVAREDPRHGSATVNNFYIRTLLGVSVYQLPLGEITRQHLEEAKRVLQDFAVLILEQHDQNDALLECYMGWPRKDGNGDSAKKVINKTGGSMDQFVAQNVDQEWIAKLEEINLLDAELYEFAVQLSADQLAKCPTKPTA